MGRLYILAQIDLENNWIQHQFLLKMLDDYFWVDFGTVFTIKVQAMSPCPKQEKRTLTLPETNSLHLKKMASQKEISSSNHQFFAIVVSGRVI